MAKKTTKDYFSEFRRQSNERLKKAGFDIAKLTEDQLYLINEPSDAPENYACDGEISPNQAYSAWINRMTKAGLNREQVNQAIKYNFR